MNNTTGKFHDTGIFSPETEWDSVSNRAYALESSEELQGYLEDLTHNYGFDAFFLIRRSNSVKSFSEQVIATSLEEADVEIMGNMQLNDDCPMLKEVSRSMAPIVWVSSNRAENLPPVMLRNIITLPTNFDFNSGVCLPVSSANGKQGVLGFVGRRRLSTLEEIQELLLEGNLLFDRALQIQRVKQTNKRKPSNREIECLRWTAEGKTSTEIGMILNLSEHTINNYLASVCKKMNATNRSHAIYKALREDLI